MTAPAGAHLLLHPATTAGVLLVAGLLGGFAAGPGTTPAALLLLAVAGAAAGFANSGST